jgi:hypothetical protein
MRRLRQIGGQVVPSQHLSGLHRGIPHYFFTACLIYRELRQMLFSCGMCGRYLFKLLLHPLKDKARPRQPRGIVVALVLTQEFALPSDAVLLVLDILSG